MQNRAHLSFHAAHTVRMKAGSSTAAQIPISTLINVTFYTYIHDNIDNHNHNHKSENDKTFDSRYPRTQPIGPHNQSR